MEIKLIAKFIMRKLGYEVINLKHGNTGGGGGTAKRFFARRGAYLCKGTPIYHDFTRAGD